MTATRVPAKFESMFGDVGIDPTFEAIADESGVGVEDARGVLTGAIDDAETVQKIADTLCIVPEALADRISSVTNVNFARDLSDRAAFEGMWPPATTERLTATREQWDPDGVFAPGPS